MSVFLLCAINSAWDSFVPFACLLSIFKTSPWAARAELKSSSMATSSSDNSASTACTFMVGFKHAIPSGACALTISRLRLGVR